MRAIILAAFLAGFNFAHAGPPSDQDVALLKLANDAVEVCLNHTTYITNREVTVLAPKFVQGQAVVCEVSHPGAAKKKHKK